MPVARADRSRTVITASARTRAQPTPSRTNHRRGTAAGRRGILRCSGRRAPAHTLEALTDPYMTSRLLCAAAAAAFLFSTFAVPATSVFAQSGKPALGSFGIDTAAMDTSVKPGDDFFGYVNGKWIATFKIPADKASLRHVHDARRQGRGGRADLDRRVEQDPAAGRVGAAEGRRPLQRLDGRGHGRGARADAAQGRPRRDRRRRIEEGPAAADGPHRLHRPVRRVHHSRPGRPDALRGRDHAGRSRHAGPRLLPEQRREVRRLSRRLQDLPDAGLRAARRCSRRPTARRR